MSSAEQVVRRYLAENYGDLITSEKPTQDSKTGEWEARLQSTYPRIIQDAKSEDVIVRFLQLRDLGVVRLNKGLRVTNATSSEDAELQLGARLDLWKNQAERIVVNASSDVFAKIVESLHVLNPLKQILDQLTKRSENIRLSDIEIDDQARPVRIRQYLDLLVELQIVRRVEDGYSYGNTFTALAEQTRNDFRTLETALISHVIRQKYSTLRQVFDITQLEPFIHLDNCYYWPALDAEKLVKATRSSMYQRQLDYYDWMPTWDFDSKLQDLLDQGELVEEDGYIGGNVDHFDKMLELKREIVVLNP